MGRTTKPTTKPRRVLLRDWESRAFAEGRKTLIVRPIVPQPVCDIPGAYFDAYNGGPAWWWWTPDGRLCNGHGANRCPFGSPGDELVGYEAWARAYMDDKEYLESIESGEGSTAVYRADWPEPRSAWCGAGENWRSAATMPAWAARHRWTVESVAAKRLGDVTEEEAIAFGVQSWDQGYPRSTGEPYEGYETMYGCGRAFRWVPMSSPNAVLAFQRQWDEDFGKRYPVESSPWIWLVRVAPKAR